MSRRSCLFSFSHSPLPCQISRFLCAARHVEGLMTSGAAHRRGRLLAWSFRRWGRPAGGRAGNHREGVGRAGGGPPLFVLVAAAPVVPRPQLLLLPVLLVLLIGRAHL